MGYVSDWDHWAKAAADAAARYPNCDRTLNCTAGPLKYAPDDDNHVGDCRWRRMEHKKLRFVMFLARYGRKEL